ncbi:MAG: Lrp/AsnC family transcriptional regulator [Beijerinckiaceae bacterium]|jgi:Lrp/AsnC family transcriptional regulator|nr:Lrp/AsnC family transcriptional regulator [Beijerinckiaceae bacterium]
MVDAWDIIPWRRIVVLDDIDRRLLVELQVDASESLEKLGERVGLSRNACWTRVKRLEEAGVLKARIALVDPEKINLGLSVFIAVRTNEHDPEWLETFAQVTSAMPEVQGVYRTAGDLDYLIRARVPDVAAYDALYQRLIRKVRLSDVSASFVMQEIKETTALPLNYAQ